MAEHEDEPEEPFLKPSSVLACRNGSILVAMVERGPDPGEVYRLTPREHKGTDPSYATEYRVDRLAGGEVAALAASGLTLGRDILFPELRKSQYFTYPWMEPDSKKARSKRIPTRRIESGGLARDMDLYHQGCAVAGLGLAPEGRVLVLSPKSGLWVVGDSFSDAALARTVLLAVAAARAGDEPAFRGLTSNSNLRTVMMSRACFQSRTILPSASEMSSAAPRALLAQTGWAAGS